MTIGAFTDRQHPPSPEEVADALGESRAAWEGLVEHVTTRYRVRRDWGFYGKSYGWAERFRKGGKALLSMYPRRGGFTVQVILGEEGVQAALAHDIGESARRAIAAANPYPEGRWLFIAVDSERDAADVEYLLGLKEPPPDKTPRGAPSPTSGG